MYDFGSGSEIATVIRHASDGGIKRGFSVNGSGVEGFTNAFSLYGDWTGNNEKNYLISIK